MTNDPLVPAIEALRAQEAAASATVAELETRLAWERERLEKVRTALAGLLNLTADSDGGEVDVPVEPGVPVPDTNSGEREQPTRTPRAGGRIPTPSIVTAIVTERGGVVTREEVIAEAIRRVGERVSEWSDPRNVITVALNRAAERGHIVKIDSDNYRPAEPDGGAVDGE